VAAARFRRAHRFAAEFGTAISWTTAMDIGGEPGSCRLSAATPGTSRSYASALIYAAGVVCRWLIDPVTPVEL
jgi:hypothetical protein